MSEFRVRHDVALCRLAEIASCTTFMFVRTIAIIDSRRARDPRLDCAPMSGPKWVIFDLDGTLTKREVMAHVGDRAGFGDDARQAILQYENAPNGTGSNTATSRRLAQLLRGARRDDLVALVDSIPTVDDIGQVVDSLRAQGIKCGISTLTFDFAAEHFQQQFGFDHVVASSLEYSDDGVATGNVHALEARHKLIEVERICEVESVSIDEIVFIGNGTSDLDAMRSCGISIAFNASRTIEQLACLSATSNTLHDALPTDASRCSADRELRRLPCTHERRRGGQLSLPRTRNSVGGDLEQSGTLSMHEARRSPHAT